MVAGLKAGLWGVSGKSGTKFSTVRNFFLGGNGWRVEDRIHQRVFENLSGRLHPWRVLAIVENLPDMFGLVGGCCVGEFC